MLDKNKKNNNDFQKFHDKINSYSEAQLKEIFITINKEKFPDRYSYVQKLLGVTEQKKDNQENVNDSFEKKSSITNDNDEDSINLIEERSSLGIIAFAIFFIAVLVPYFYFGVFLSILGLAIGIIGFLNGVKKNLFLILGILFNLIHLFPVLYGIFSNEWMLP